jgi:hypothetical protein
VGKSIYSTAKGYFHDMDPYRLHSTKAIAMKERSRVAKLGGKKRLPRVSTFYTILQDKRKNNPQKFGSVPQGPHTFPHHGIHSGIIEARAQNKLNIFDNVIPSPSDYGKRVDSEIPVGHVKRPRAELAKTIFKKRHTRFSTLSKIVGRTELQDIRLSHVINKLIQMDPHGSYAYKSGGASKKALKGKGESTLLPLAQQIDLPKNSGFSNLSAVQTRSQTLLSSLGKVGVK